MHIEEFRNYCLSKPGVTESFPFDEVTLVFKVISKVFAITGLDNEQFTVNLKCDPERALDLREQYPEVQPGFHMNKKHWNTVDFEGSLEHELLIELVDHSYDLVAQKLKKAEKEVLKTMSSPN